MPIGTIAAVAISPTAAKCIVIAIIAKQLRHLIIAVIVVIVIVVAFVVIVVNRRVLLEQTPPGRVEEPLRPRGHAGGIGAGGAVAGSGRAGGGGFGAVRLRRRSRRGGGYSHTQAGLAGRRRRTIADGRNTTAVAVVLPPTSGRADRRSCLVERMVHLL